MSRAERRRQEREAQQARSARRTAPFWIIGGFAAAGILGVAIYAQIASPGHHPEPRAAASHPHVVESERYASYPRAEQTYVWAASIPGVLDGMYCFCQCKEHSGHYSLLDCFASDHGAQCDVCMNEAEIAYQMTQQGASLAEIRAEVDRVYGA